MTPLLFAPLSYTAAFIISGGFSPIMDILSLKFILIQQRLFVNVTFRSISCFYFTNGTYFVFSSNTPLERV